MDLLVEPSALMVLHKTTESCDHDWSSVIAAIADPISMSDLASKIGEMDVTLPEVFGNLVEYAKKNNLTTLNAQNTVEYFAGDHFMDAHRSVQFSPEQGPEADLVAKMLANCVLWVLDENLVFRIAEREVKISGADVDLTGEGIPCIHRRSIFRINIPKAVADKAMEELAENKLFLAALDRIGPELELPLVPIDG